METGNNEILKKADQLATGMGITKINIIPAEKISIENELAERCSEPRCKGFGKTPYCPPNVMLPDDFREFIKKYNSAIIFKIDVPTEIFHTEDRRELGRIIHETAAKIESLAVENGYPNSKGFAGGSCKIIHCGELDICPALEDIDNCEFSHLVRPSMSGFGINVSEIDKAADWRSEKGMSKLSGMVLI